MQNIVPWPGYEANCSQALPHVPMKYEGEESLVYNLHDVILQHTVITAIIANRDATILSEKKMGYSLGNCHHI